MKDAQGSQKILAVVVGALFGVSGISSASSRAGVAITRQASRPASALVIAALSGLPSSLLSRYSAVTVAAWTSLASGVAAVAKWWIPKTLIYFVKCLRKGSSLPGGTGPISSLGRGSSLQPVVESNNPRKIGVKRRVMVKNCPALPYPAITNWFSRGDSWGSERFGQSSQGLYPE